MDEEWRRQKCVSSGYRMMSHKRNKGNIKKLEIIYGQSSFYAIDAFLKAVTYTEIATFFFFFNDTLQFLCECRCVILQ
jgi:hypothetical protein